MLKASVNSDKYQASIEHALNHVKNLGFEDIQSRHDDYKDPSKLKMKDQEVEFTPDITATKLGAKFYFEIADRTEAQQKVIGKWKLLETLAQMKNGELKIFVPHGCMKYTRDILEKSRINADIIKIRDK